MESKDIVDALRKERNAAAGPFFGTPIETPAPESMQPQKPPGRIKPVATRRPKEPDPKDPYPGEGMRGAISNAFDKVQGIFKKNPLEEE